MKLSSLVAVALSVPLLAAAFTTRARAQAPTPPPATTTTTTTSDEEPGDAAMWAARERQLAEQDTLTGGVGLLHTQHAQSGAPGQFRMGFTSELFSSGFLCSASYPCANPKGGPDIIGDSLTHVGGTLTLSATITKWLEAYAAAGAFGSSDSANHPSLLQVFGDTQLGLKFYYPLTPVFHVGAVTELDLVNASGSVGLVGAGTGGKFRALGTADLRGLDPGLPLRFSLNMTYAVDNSAQVLSDYEAAIAAPVTRIERFGLDVNRVDHFDLALGGETFLASDRVRPFLEYTLLAPINRQGYLCRPNNPSADQCLANDKVAPSKLTFGSRFFPWKRGFSVVAAFDIGVTGTANFIEELAPTPPWMLYLGVGWAVDTRERPPVTVTRTVEKVIPPIPPGQIRGLVHVNGKVDVIPFAIIALEEHPEITSRVSGMDGRFAIPVPTGTYKLAVHAKGYRDGTCGDPVTMLPSRVDVTVDCPLDAALVNVEANEITIGQQIQFGVDQANILPESDGLMHEIADALIKNPRIQKVEVQGHTDSSGTKEYNQTLSEQRAAAVRDWLTAHGVTAERLTARGYGEDRPLIPNVTKALKALNRRVQFIILEQTPEK